MEMKEITVMWKKMCIEETDDEARKEHDDAYTCIHITKSATDEPGQSKKTSLPDEEAEWNPVGCRSESSKETVHR